MILEELRLLKSFGDFLDSTVTEADIAAKEQELGVELPEALRELYLTFNPEDPIFTAYHMVPLAELTVRRAENDWQIFQTIPVLVGENRTYGPAISAERKYGNDKPSWMWHEEELGLVMRGTFPKKVTSKPLKLVRGLSGCGVSARILGVLGTQVIGAAPSLAGAREQDETGQRRTPQATKAFGDTITPSGPCPASVRPKTASSTFWRRTRTAVTGASPWTPPSSTVRRRANGRSAIIWTPSWPRSSPGSS